MSESERQRLLDRAESLLALGQWDQAAALFHELTRLDPLRGLLGQGETAVQRGDGQEAYRHFAQASQLVEDIRESTALAARQAELAREQQPAAVGRGRALLLLAQLPEALAAFDEALQLDPDCPAAHHGRGLVLAAQGQHTEAERAQERATAGERPPYAAWIALGELRAERGRFDEAMYAFGQALQQDPDQATGVLHAARLLAALGDLDQAEEVLEEAAQGVLADDPEVLYELAQVYLLSEQLDTLGGVALRLQTVLPRVPAALGLVAGFLLRAGLPALARERIEEALTLDPSPAELADLTKLLAELDLTEKD